MLYSIQTFPGDLKPPTFPDPDNPELTRGRNELERRGDYIQSLEARYGSTHPNLVLLVKQCLHNAPNRRPSTEQLLTRLQGMRAAVEGEYGGGAVKVDLARVKLTKEVKEKDRRIQQLTQQQVHYS